MHHVTQTLGAVPHLIHVVIEGNVYSCTRRYQHDSSFLLSLHRILSNTPPDNVFNKLYHAFSNRWHPQDDIPYPFGDHRESLVYSSWVVDLDNNLVTLRKKDRNHYQIWLSQVLQTQNISVDDMHSIMPLLIPQLSTDSYFRNSIWEPEVTPLTSYQSAFTVRLLNDLVYQWRHVFRGPYNDTTFRKLASAIFRIILSDFTVKEISSGRGGTAGRVVWLTDLPSWKPVPDRVVHFDHVSVVLCQYSAHAMELIRDDRARRQQQRRTEGSPSLNNCVSITYIVLSVREIFLFQTCHWPSHAGISTKPERLFNGIDSASERALAYLLMIVPQCTPSPLHALPLELQDMILCHASSGLVESARVGCAMSLGTPFRWKGYWGQIERQNVFVARTPETGVESQIWFDEYHSGLVYK